nr:tail fiber protein [Pectobacterium carotovorum]
MVFPQKTVNLSRRVVMKLSKALFAKTALASTLAVVLLHTENASACAAEPLIGSVCFMATNYCPQGFLPAKGQVVQINAYQALYALVSNTYGGSAASGTFGLPDLRGRGAIGTGQGTGLSNVVLGQTLGAETATLSIANLAAHSHTVTQTQPPADNVFIPAVPGTLNVTASLPLATTAPASGGAAPVSGLNYLTAIAGTVPAGAGTSNVTFKGPYTQTKPGAGATLPADVVTTGNSTIPAFSFKVPTVTVGTTGSSTPIAVRDPALGLTACIAAQGIYPQHP